MCQGFWVAVSTVPAGVVAIGVDVPYGDSEYLTHVGLVRYFNNWYK